MMNISLELHCSSTFNTRNARERDYSQGLITQQPGLKLIAPAPYHSPSLSTDLLHHIRPAPQKPAHIHIQFKTITNPENPRNPLQPFTHKLPIPSKHHHWCHWNSQNPPAPNPAAQPSPAHRTTPTPTTCICTWICICTSNPSLPCSACTTTSTPLAV